MNMHKPVFSSFNDFSPFKYIHVPHPFFLSSYGHYINKHTHTHTIPTQILPYVQSAHKQLEFYEQVPSGLYVLLCRFSSQVPTNDPKHCKSWQDLNSSTWSYRTGEQEGTLKVRFSIIEESVDDTVVTCRQKSSTVLKVSNPYPSLTWCYTIPAMSHSGKPRCLTDNALLITAGGLKAKRKCY